MPKQHVLFPTQSWHFLVYIGGPACLARVSLSTLLFWLPQTLLFLEQTVLLEVIACFWKASAFLHCLPSLFVYLDQFRCHLSVCPPQTLPGNFQFPGNFQVSPCSLCLSIVSQRFFYYTAFFYYATLQWTSQCVVRSMKKAAESYFPGVSMSQHGVWAKSLFHVVLIDQWTEHQAVMGWREEDPRPTKKDVLAYWLSVCWMTRSMPGESQERVRRRWRDSVRSASLPV